jgi:hypothetical protein
MLITKWAHAFHELHPELHLPTIVATMEALRVQLADADQDSSAADSTRLILGLTTDNPAVMAVMGTKDMPCALRGCQYGLRGSRS